MLRLFYDEEQFDKLKIKIDYITKLSCYKEDFVIHKKLVEIYNTLENYDKSDATISDIYNVFDDIDIWDIDHMDAEGLDLIIDIFDMLGYMIIGDAWDNDELWYSTMTDFLISSLYYEDEDYINQKKEIINSLTKIISFFKSIMIYQNIFI